jgi:outer membrane protein/protease secretion system outer membrane protein
VATLNPRRLVACALLASALLALSPTAHALDLLQAYEAASGHDANWLAAQARAAAGQERLPQAEAALQPNVSVSASRMLNDLSTRSGGTAPATMDRYPSGSYALTLRQPVFNTALRSQRARAQAQVEEADATMKLERQNMALRVVASYLDALSAQDEVALSATQTAFYARQLDAARKLFAAGAGTRTDADEVQAKLDMARAMALDAKQAAGLALRKLQVLVREPLERLDPLAPLNPTRLQWAPPQPEALQDEISRAEGSNPELRVLKAQQAAATQEVRRLRAGHLPTLDAVAQWSRGDRDNSNAPSYRIANKSIGLQLTVPLYAGGGINSQVRQAQEELLAVEQLLDGLRQDLAVRLQKELDGLADGAGRIQALETAERSAAQVLVSTQKSYAGGSRTVLDVLNAEQQLATVVRDLARARYGMLMSRARLLSLTDALDHDALTALNACFGK